MTRCSIEFVSRPVGVMRISLNACGNFSLSICVSTSLSALVPITLGALDGPNSHLVRRLLSRASKAWKASCLDSDRDRDINLFLEQH